jgi:hypothetical protein
VPHVPKIVVMGQSNGSFSKKIKNKNYGLIVLIYLKNLDWEVLHKSQ